MSGPVQPDDLDPEASSRPAPDPTAPATPSGSAPPADPHGDVEVTEGRRAALPGLDVVRVLPTKGRRTVGPWCFVDCMLPPDVQDPDPMEVGPHPHIGLSTVTWLFTGEAVHGDSLGTEQLIRPGQLNLMTAGNGIAHAELGLGTGLQGIQMWVALPEATRHGPPAFEHHGDLPQLELPTAEATVFMGALGGVASPARHDSPLVGVELRMRAGRVDTQVDPAFEHAVVPLDHPVKVGESVVEPGWLGYVPAGVDALHVEAGELGGRVMVLGGEPFERVRMWWNFVGRDTEELTQAWRDWQDRDTDRFPTVRSTLARMDAPRPPWLPADRG